MDLRQNTRSQLAVAFGLLVFVAIVYGEAAWLTHRMPSVHPAISPSVASATPRVNASPIPANVPVVAVPTFSPPTWPTPPTDALTATSAPSVPWKVTRMTDPRTHQTYWMAPPGVVAQVRQDYQEMDAYYNAHVFDKKVSAAARFYTEPMLDQIEKEDQADVASGVVRGAIHFLRPTLQIVGFSADGRVVQVAQEFHGELVPVYDASTRRLLREEKLPSGLDFSTLIYDPQDQRWKVSENVFVPAPPGVQ